MALETPMVTTYMGEDIKTLSREQLIEALELAVSEMASMRKRHMRDIEMLELFNGRKAA